MREELTYLFIHQTLDNPSDPRVEKQFLDYDASGERGIRYVPRQMGGVYSATQAGYAQDIDIMLYPNALITVRPQEIPEDFDPNDKDLFQKHTFTTYTKHYYIGSERINSKLGTVKDLGVLCEQMAGNDLIDEMNTRTISAGDQLENLYNYLNKDLDLSSPYLYITYHAFACYYNHNEELYDSYWYHPDHLGSSSFITNTTGEISQHMEYLPFGETLVEEHLNSYNSPFKFNAKEFDAETGNYYGARYLNPKWNTFLTPDPALESYPGISPYAYTLNNPVRYVDPTGMYVEERDDDYIIDQQGNINLIRKTDDSFDRILQTDKQGDIKTKGNSFLVSKSERGKEKVAVDNIAKGILKDGLNLKEKNGSFDVNGENQPTLEEFDKFISEFSDYIKIEIAGIRLGRDVENDLVDRVQTYRYKENTQFTAKTPKSWFTKFGNHLKSHFHTHPFGDHTPSEEYDIPLRKSYPNLQFFIIANGYEKKY